MTDQSSSTASPIEPTTPSRPRRRWPLVTAAALAAALTGAVATHAFSNPGFAHGPWGGHGFVGASFDPTQAEDRVDRMMRHLAIEVDATADQETRLRTIAKAAVKDLIPMRERAVAGRQRARTLLTQPTVDRGAIEAFRAEQMALADAASRRVAQALADAAETLTPDQRRKLDDRLSGARGLWHGWRRG
ncbi:MAG: Spy/CpxP family protein refolding chaperone [Hyphomicrobiales bacterium]|nr:Spy/CpxP family protein refolding chaperone [Hyphomicrobiales bacterium]